MPQWMLRLPVAASAATSGEKGSDATVSFSASIWASTCAAMVTTSAAHGAAAGMTSLVACRQRCMSASRSPWKRPR